ncbi:unnamed protein product, partial [Rotaria sp. Silwood2]
MRALSVNTTEESMEADFGDTSKNFANKSSQTEDFNLTFLTRSDSINMIVDSPATTTATASDTASTKGLASSL